MNYARPALYLLAFAAATGVAFAQTSPPGAPDSKTSPMPGATLNPSTSTSTMGSGSMAPGSTGPGAMAGGMGTDMGPAPTGPDHGMPAGKAGGDGMIYTGAPDLVATISLVTAGGPVGQFSIAKALESLAGAETANAEIAKLQKQYGEANFSSFVAVQNFAVDDAVKIATAAGVTFPAPSVSGKALAARVVKLGLVDGTYYEGTQLDHLVTSKIHSQVMDDIDKKFGAPADANYHRIADQAHTDLAHALGMNDVGLAAYH